MLKMKDDHHRGLPFGSLVTRICQQYVLDIPALESVQRPDDSFGKHTVMKSDEQLPQVEEPQIAEYPPPAPLAQFDPLAASSSQVVYLLSQLRRRFPRLWYSKSTSMLSIVYNIWSMRMTMMIIDCCDHFFFFFFGLLFETIYFYSYYFGY
jgi:hypothetical protein